MTDSKKTIGIVGGGQLCLMMGEAIKEKQMPYTLIAIDPTPNCPAKDVIDEQLVGDYKDEEQIRKLGSASDILTFEIELANSMVLQELRQKGLQVHPSPDTLRVIQDKYTQALFLRNHNIPVPDFRELFTKQDIQQAISDFGLPLMIKARTDSYDGKGNFVIRYQEQIDEVLSYFEGRTIMAQKFIPFDIEVSVISARNIHGQIATFPLGENIHGANYNILEKTIVPARVSTEIIEKAKKVAENTMEAFKGAGVFGIEMFVIKGDVLINEIAPRVHNSGHYTIEACYTSQFEQHIRAITGEELGNCELVSSSAVMYNIIGQEGFEGKYAIKYNGETIIGTQKVEPTVFIHDYLKHQVKPFRKMGHFTVVAKDGETQQELILRAQEINKNIEIIIIE